MSYVHQNANFEIRKALDNLHDELSWDGVADYLSKAIGERVSGALIWKVAHGKCESDKVQLALVKLKLIDAPPPTVEVHVCADCGELHTQHKTCPTAKEADTRKRRAWAGSGERAEILDRIVAEQGFPSLAKMVDTWIDDAQLF